MKQTGLIIRTVAALAVIFASGVWVGHTFCPKESPAGAPIVIQSTAPDRPSVKPDLITGKIARHYRRELLLDQSQFERFIPLLMEQQKNVTGLPIRSAERAESVRKFHELIRKFLRPDQEPGLEKIMKKVEDQIVE